MTFPHPAPLFASKRITSIWTDFKDAYDGKTLIGSYPTGSFMSDWSALTADVPSTRTVTTAAGSISGQALHLAGTSGLNASSFLTWDYLAPLADADILLGIKPVTIVAGEASFGIAGRVLDSPIRTRSGHINPSGAPRLAALSGVSGDLSPITNTVTTGQWYWLRLNLSGNDSRAKFWLRSASEPSSYMNTLNSTVALLAGATGVTFNIANTNDCLIDFFSVSIDGSPAYGPGL